MGPYLLSHTKGKWGSLMAENMFKFQPMILEI